MSNRLRRTQAIVPFGVGAMVDFPGPVSLIHAGLDAWPFEPNNHQHHEFKIEDEPRLAARLNVAYFVTPPDFRTPKRHGAGNQPNVGLRLPFLRFPTWHVCPRCGRMWQSALHDRSAPTCEGPIGSGRDRGRSHSRRRTVQVRFVCACPRGHLMDFPWWEWVHRKAAPSREGWLRMHSRGSASLAGVRIQAEVSNGDLVVSKSRTLAGAFGSEPPNPSPLSRLGVLCRGENPALGIPSPTQPAPGCGEHLYPLLRGSSNVYFPRVVSAIYLPPIDPESREEVLELLEDHRLQNFLVMMADTAEGHVLPEHCRAALRRLYPERDVSPEELAEAANRRLSGSTVGQDNTQVEETEGTEGGFRRQERELLSRDVEVGYPRSDLLVRGVPLTEYEPLISSLLKRISLVQKLRETRAFTGFSRIFPSDALTDDDRRSLISREPVRWLPAVVVRGEGIYLELSEKRIRSWLEACGARLEARLAVLQATFDDLRHRQRLESMHVTPRFVLLHTFSHLLINQLIFECGYGSSSLRERIYCSDGDRPMAGLLIYTAAGDAEGTMGGLVRMGHPGRIERVLEEAISRARWCSNDPVCIESSGQGPDSCNLAACHSCALLPETACEEQNRLLDRGVLVGTLLDQDLGFFTFKD